MALTDPQNITVGSAYVLARVQTEPMAATYADPTSVISLRVIQTVTKNSKRSVITASRKKTWTDPTSGLPRDIYATVTKTVVRPLAGFTEAELLELITGVDVWGNAATNANNKKVLGLES